MNGVARRISIAAVAGLLLGGSMGMMSIGTLGIGTLGMGMLGTGMSGMGLLVQPVFAADLAAAKATVDGAKAAGLVGEQGDGYLGLVSGSADAATTAAVNAINAARKQAYAATAAKTGVTPEAAGEAVAKQQFERMPAGQYFKPIGGGWTKK